MTSVNGVSTPGHMPWYAKLVKCWAKLLIIDNELAKNDSTYKTGQDNSVTETQSAQPGLHVYRSHCGPYWF